MGIDEKLREVLKHGVRSKSTDKLVAELLFASTLDLNKVDTMEIDWQTVHDGDFDVIHLPKLKVKMK